MKLRKLLFLPLFALIFTGIACQSPDSETDEIPETESPAPITEPELEPEPLPEPEGSPDGPLEEEIIPETTDPILEEDLEIEEPESP